MTIKKAICFILVIQLLFIKSNQAADRAKKTKIVGFLPAKNEGAIIEQCIRALSLYTDAIVFLDDNSDDDTVAIVKRLAKECNIERIIEKKNSWKRELSKDQNMMLKAGREIGGTHFVYIDADEMFTAHCLKDNFLRKEILRLEPGQSIALPWIQLWRNVHQYRYDDGILLKEFIFCDDGTCFYTPKYLHSARVPKTLNAKKRLIKTHGVLHFQGVNRINMGIRQAWYRCLEHIRTPEKSITDINENENYKNLVDETGTLLQAAPSHWYEGYSFFDETAYHKPETWRKKQVYKWFDEYGFAYFEDLDLSGLFIQFIEQKQ